MNGIVDELQKDARIQRLYGLWYEQREAVIQTYTDHLPERVPLSQNKTFRTVKNAVIQEALNLLCDRVTFEDVLIKTDEMTRSVGVERLHSNSSSTYNYFPTVRNTGTASSALRLFAQLSQVLLDELNKDADTRGAIEKKLRQKIAEKEMAHGIKMG